MPTRVSREHGAEWLFRVCQVLWRDVGANRWMQPSHTFSLVNTLLAPRVLQRSRRLLTQNRRRQRFTKSFPPRVISSSLQKDLHKQAALFLTAGAPVMSFSLLYFIELIPCKVSSLWLLQHCIRVGAIVVTGPRNRLHLSWRPLPLSGPVLSGSIEHSAL